jgi:hypothetical protein
MLVLPGFLSAISILALVIVMAVSLTPRWYSQRRPNQAQPLVTSFSPAHRLKPGAQSDTVERFSRKRTSHHTSYPSFSVTSSNLSAPC